jgi:hypothetical protein
MNLTLRYSLLLQPASYGRTGIATGSLEFADSATATLCRCIAREQSFISSASSAVERQQQSSAHLSNFLDTFGIGKGKSAPGLKFPGLSA